MGGLRQSTRQLGVLFWRSGVDILRNPALLLMHMTMSIVLGLLVGFVYYQTSLEDAGAQNR